MRLRLGHRPRCWWGAYSPPPDSLVVFNGANSQCRGRAEWRGQSRVEGAEGKGGKDGRGRRERGEGDAPMERKGRG